MDWAVIVNSWEHDVRRKTGEGRWRCSELISQSASLNRGLLGIHHVVGNKLLTEKHTYQTFLSFPTLDGQMGTHTHTRAGWLLSLVATTE